MLYSSGVGTERGAAAERITQMERITTGNLTVEFEHGQWMSNGDVIDAHYTMTVAAASYNEAFDADTLTDFILYHFDAAQPVSVERRSATGAVIADGDEDTTAYVDDSQVTVNRVRAA